MKRQFSAKLACTLTLCALLVTTAPVQTGHVSASTRLQSQQGAVLQQWLARRPWLRVATESDCRNRAGLRDARQEYGAAYQPYFAAGDFNGDGQNDFAVVLVDQRKRSRKFAIAIFNGPFDPSRAANPAFYTEGLDLSTGGLVLREGNRLLAGVFQTDDCVTLNPRGPRYVMQTCP